MRRSTVLRELSIFLALFALATVMTDAILRDNPSVVTLCYFVFLKRDPDKGDVDYWIRILKNSPKREAAVISGFINSPEYRAR
jgi:hypothetical protein